MSFIAARVTRRTTAILAVPLLAAGAWGVHRIHAQAPASESLAHVRSEFRLSVHAPMNVAAPLFGADAERGWGGEDWKPKFLYPQPAKDIEGAVFSVGHGQHDSTWVATAMDFPGGHVQYVSVINGVMVTWIDIRLKPRDVSNTAVTVVYERTALQVAANETVRALGPHDEGNGKDWEASINDYLSAQTKARR